MKSSRRKARRSNRGISLAELVVGSILMAASLAVVAELMSLCVITNSKLFNQFDAQAGANFALDRIKRDVRLAREICSETNEFGNVTKRLDSSTLILHLPILYAAKRDEPGDPTYNPSAEPDPLSGFPLPGYYTILYEIVPNPSVPDEYALSYSCRRNPPATNELLVTRPDVQGLIVATGIVGPLQVGDGATAKPKTFSYIAKNPFFDERLDLLKEGTLNYPGVVNGTAGVSLDFEFKRGQESANKATEKIVAVHSEAMMRMPPNARGPLDPIVYEP